MRVRLVGLVALMALVAASCGGGVPEAAGPSEGIQVHGDWTLDIYNEDGSLDEHVEFSNSLTDRGSEVIIDGLLGLDDHPDIWGIVMGDLGGLDFEGVSPCTEPYPPDLLAGPDSHRNPHPLLTTACFIREATPGVFFVGVAEALAIFGETTAEQDGTIDYVETARLYLDADGEALQFMTAFTRKVLASPIEVSAGQQIDVRVDITFASG